MTRIVAGIHKGRKINVPKSGTRPTSERVREALFSRLEHYGYIDKCAVLDLFAGSGALAIEALSRGAASATCVEANTAAAKIIQENTKTLGIKLEIINQKVQTYLTQEPINTCQHLKYDLVFIDPPYDFPQETLTNILEALEPQLKKDAMIIVERAKRAPQPIWPVFLELDDQRNWGDTCIWTAFHNPSEK